MDGGARAAGSQRNSGKGPMNQEKELQQKEKSLNQYVFLQTYLLRGVTGIGYLALMWSTVVLLGGFVSTLGKKDFWCITAISMIQAAGIFNGWGEGGEGVIGNFILGIWMILHDDSFKTKQINIVFIPLLPLMLIVILVMLIVINVMLIIFMFGSFICAGISLLRMIQRDSGNIYGDSTKANLMPAMDIFYSLVIFQGTLYFLWFTSNFVRSSFVASVNGMFPEVRGGRSLLEAYLIDSRSKCWRDPRSIRTRRLIKYTVDLLDSESSQEYLFAARFLDALIKRGVDVRPFILPLSQKVQKLMDTLRRRSSDREVRELSARILAHIAYDIDLTMFPGLLRCIFSLLDTTLPYWNSEGERSNELILQGLTILERLASDQHNCRDICSTPSLLPKIMAPLYSKILVKHINVSSWADVVNGSLKVVHRLIRAPGSTSRRLSFEIASSKQAVSNLEGILDQSNNAGLELQMRSIEILTELAFDLHTNLSKETKENIIAKQTQIFLTDDQGKEESDTKFTELKVTAGKALLLLSDTELLSQTGSISVFIKSKYSYIIQRLTEMLDAKNKIINRRTAAQILENLCTHHVMDNNHMKKTLLPKVLTEVLSSKGEPPSKICTLGNGAENRELSAQGTDEENQIQGHKSQIKSSSQEDEVHTDLMGFQEAFLSLTLAMCKKLKISAGDFDDVAQKIPHKDGEVVAKLKAIVEENCKATADCLRIVKLCGEISVIMMQRSQYIPHFRDQQFLQSLSKALKNMSNLESCMLFAGTDCEAKNTVEPLLFDLEKEVLKLVG